MISQLDSILSILGLLKPKLFGEGSENARNLNQFFDNSTMSSEAVIGVSLSGCQLLEPPVA